MTKRGINVDFRGNKLFKSELGGVFPRKWVSSGSAGDDHVDEWMPCRQEGSGLKTPSCDILLDERAKEDVVRIRGILKGELVATSDAKL